MWLNHYHYDTFQPVEVVDGKVDMNKSYNEFLFNFSTNSLGDINSLSSQLDPAIENPIVFERKPNKLDVDKEILEKYVGEYRLSSDVIIKIFFKGDILYAFIPDQSDYELYPIDEHIFAIKILDGYKLEFEVNDKGKVLEVSFIQPNGIFKAKRIK